MKKYVLTAVLIILVSLTIIVMLEMDKDRERKNEQAKKPDPALSSDKLAHYRTSPNDSIAFGTGFFTKEKQQPLAKPTR